MNRFDRVIAILIQLQSKKVVRAYDMAERFGISLRTVYRDINTLAEAGIPIISEAGIGYSIMEGYRLPPVMFTKEEALAFITAEKFIEKQADTSIKSAYKSAIFKIRSVLRSSEKDLLENLENHIEVFQNYPPLAAHAHENTLQSLLKAISEKKVLKIHYNALSSDELTQRKIEPIGVFHSGGYWHVVAYCRLRNDYRDFRTDRIRKSNETDEIFSRKHPSLRAYLDEISKQRKLERIVIDIKPNTAKYLGQQKFYFGYVSEEASGDNIRMTFLSESPAIFIRWYLLFALDAEIVEPNYLQDLLQDYIMKIEKKFIPSFPS